MTLKTVLNKVIVEPVEAEEKTASGIIIPDSATKRHHYCHRKREIRRTDGSKDRRYSFIW